MFCHEEWGKILKAGNKAHSWLQETFASCYSCCYSTNWLGSQIFVQGPYLIFHPMPLLPHIFHNKATNLVSVNKLMLWGFGEKMERKKDPDAARWMNEQWIRYILLETYWSSLGPTQMTTCGSRGLTTLKTYLHPYMFNIVPFRG